MKKLIIVTVLFLAAIAFAQSNVEVKPDSTQFRFWVNEFQNTQKQLATLDSTKLELQGIAKYQYQKAVEEKQKIDVYNSNKYKKEEKK